MHNYAEISIIMHNLGHFGKKISTFSKENAQKWKLDQFLKHTPRNIPNGVRKSKKVGSNALANQISRPKNIEIT